MPYVTTGYRIPITIASFAYNALETTQKVMKAAIDRHQWRIYKEDPLSITAGPRGAVGRAFQFLGYLGPDEVTLTFKPVDSTSLLTTICFSIPKTKYTHTKSMAESFRRIDAFWESVQQLAVAYDLQTLRMDQYVRELDHEVKEQRLFVATLKRSILGSWGSKCPCCGDSISYPATEKLGVKECQTCKRIFILKAKE